MEAHIQVRFDVEEVMFYFTLMVLTHEKFGLGIETSYY